MRSVLTEFKGAGAQRFVRQHFAASYVAAVFIGVLVTTWLVEAWTSVAESLIVAPMMSAVAAGVAAVVMAYGNHVRGTMPANQRLEPGHN